MAFLIKLVYCVAMAAVATALPPRAYLVEEPQDSYQPQPFAEEPSYETFSIPTGLQLPKSQPAPVPFFAPDLSTALKAPQYPQEPNYYEVPIPAQELVAPAAKSWNPDNDPKFFYEVPTSVNVPTNAYPKKYNADIHSKSKPFSAKPKQELVLRPIGEKEYLGKQKSLNKVFDQLAKKENQKQLQVERHFAQPKSDVEFVKEFSDGDLTASAPQSHSAPYSAPHGERHEFHMTGHDGPHSYKWGFDTGKGHNRQFRYEERDKEGIVKGHFGFYDKLGKLQMINYDAHPHEGYHADGNFGKH